MFKFLILKLNKGIIDSIDQNNVIPPTKMIDLCNEEIFSK